MAGKRIVVGFAAALVGLAGAVAMPAEASAAPASVISSNSGGANLRECANSGCRSFGYLRNGTTVYMQCWVDGGQATGNYSSPRWFSVLTPALGAAGDTYIRRWWPTRSAFRTAEMRRSRDTVQQ
jgi:hypothetical protein